jgi:hypothetical protein
MVRGDKTKFVTEFLTKNPKGNLRAINEAWVAEGMTGKVSKSVVDKTRAKLRLTGNLSPKTRKDATAKATATRTRTPTSTPGRGGYAKEFLNDHPDATAREVNEAWTKAGMKGTISHSVISEVRKGLGIVGKALGETRKPTSRATPTTKSPGKKPTTQISASSSEVGTPRHESARTRALMATEVEIDRLIFQMMRLGDLTEIETALRVARRAVYKALTS